MNPINLRESEVRSLLDTGEATVERPVEPQPPLDYDPVMVAEEYPPCSDNVVGNVSWCLRNQSAFDLPRGPSDWLTLRCPLGKSGEQRWVQEEWHGWLAGSFPCIDYRAGGGDEYGLNNPGADCDLDHPCWRDWRWRPAEEMPRWASRLAVEIVRVEVLRTDNGWLWRATMRRVEPKEGPTDA